MKHCSTLGPVGYQLDDGNPKTKNFTHGKWLVFFGFGRNQPKKNTNIVTTFLVNKTTKNTFLNMKNTKKICCPVANSPSKTCWWQGIAPQSSGMESVNAAGKFPANLMCISEHPKKISDVCWKIYGMFFPKKILELILQKIWANYEIIPKPECFGHFGRILLLNYHLRWPWLRL